MSNGENSALEINIFYKILKVILYGFLLTPIWVWSAFLFPFITSKAIYFRLLLELAVAIYIPLALKYPEIRPRWNWLSKTVWIYLGVLLITSIFGLNFYKSFWGTIERGEGLVTLFHFAAYFTLLPAMLRTQKDWKRYLGAALMMIVFVGLIAVVQLGCPEGQSSPGFMCGTVPPTQGARVSSTIGNASFFAAFMLFGVFLSAYSAVEAEKKWSKRFFAAVGIFCTVILVQTQTRGGAIALFVAVFIYLLIYIWRGRNIPWRAASAACLALMLITPILLFKKPEVLPRVIRETPVVKRLSQVSKSDVTTQSRLDTWNASFLGWKDRFWTGYGYENYNIAFNKYFPPAIFKDQGSQIWFDRAHNIVFDIALTSGVFGLAAYLAIFAVSFLVIYKLWRRGALEWKRATILFTAFLAYFVQNIFVFDTQATYLLFFLLLGYLSHLGSAAPSAASLPASAQAYDWGYLPGTAAVIILIASAYFVNWQPAAANYFATEGIKSAKLQQYRSIQSNFEKALSYGTYMDEEIRQRLVDYANEAAGSGLLSPQEKQELYQVVADELDKSIKESPHDIKNYLYLMSVLNIASRELDNVDRVFDLGKTALSLSPTRMQIYTELGQAAFLKDRKEEGLEYFRKGMELNRYPKESHMNYILASILARREDITAQERKAIQDFGHALTASDYSGMARAYLQIKDLPKVVENYAAAVALQPGNMDLRVKLAAAYGEVCDLANARVQVQETVVLEPRFQADGQAFLAELEKKCKTQKLK